MESSLEVMSKLSDINIRNKHLDKASKIVNEMDKLEEEFHSAYETVWESLNLQKNNYSSSVKSVGLLQRKCNMESASELLKMKEKSTEQTVSYGNIHEPESCGKHFIGDDLWMQLKRIKIPMFTGEKRSVRNWKAVILQVPMEGNFNAYGSRTL